MSSMKIRITRKPHVSTYGLALFFFLTPFEYPMSDLMSVSPLRLVGLAALGLAAIDIIQQNRIKLGYQVVSLALWLIYGFISQLWAIDAELFQMYYPVYLNNALLFIIISFVSYTSDEMAFLKKAVIWGVGALLLYMTFVPGAIVYSEYEHRLTIRGGEGGLDQNYLASILLGGYGLMFHRLCNLKSGEKRLRVITLIYCFAAIYYIMMAGSRSGLLSIIAISLLCLNLSWKTRLLIGIPACLILIVLIPVLPYIIPDHILERFTLMSMLGQDADSGIRLTIWMHAIQAMQGFKWIFGQGVGSSQTVIGAVMNNDFAIHNHYLATVTEMGIVGLGLIVYPMVRMVKQLWAYERDVAIAFCGIIVMTFFLDVVTTKFFWMHMVLLSVCCSAYKTHNKG